MKKLYIILCAFILVLLSSFASAVITDLTNLSGYYNFNGNVLDSTDNNKDGSISGSLTARTLADGCKLGDCYEFTGGYVTLTNHYDHKYYSWTISLWANYSTYSADEVFWSGENNKGPEFRTDTVNSITSNYFTDGNEMTVATSTNPDDGDWHHFVSTYNGTHGAVYIDGELSAIDIATGTGATLPSNTFIGARPDGGSLLFGGWMDEVGFWSNRSLSRAEIVALYNGGTGLTYPFTGVDVGNNFSVTAKSSYDDGTINNFSMSVNNNASYYNTTTNTINTNISSNSSSLYDLILYSTGFFNKIYLNYNVSSDLVASLDPFNSILITIRNEETNALIYDNTSIKFQNNQSETTYYTNTSSLFRSSLDSGEYYITFDVLNTTLNYIQKSYIITMSNSSTLILNAYLTQNSSITTFTVSDRSTSGLLDNVLSTSYRMINNTWVVVQSGFTDITGQIAFQYLPYTRYKFYLAKADYEDYIFYLNPVTSSTYSINMDKISQINESQDYDQVALVYAPFLYYDNKDNNFTFLIQSPYGELISYGYDLTFPGGTASNSGSNSIGSQLYDNFTISGANVFDRVKVKYYYETAFAGRRDFTYYYPIVVESEGNNTMIANKDKTYGLGLFERIFIAVFIVLLVVGISTLIGQPIAGMGLGMLIYGYFTYIGIVPLWSVLITFMLGIIIIGSRPGS